MSIGHFIDVIVLTIFVSEVGLSIAKRAKVGHHLVNDDTSLRLIWRTIGIGITASVLSKMFLPHPVFSGVFFEYGSAALLISGMGLRWFSIIYLGREFTIDVAIIEGHRLVTTGPYKLIRHPSYTGVLLIFLGMGVHFNHIVSLVSLSFPIFWVIRYRIGVEEKALESFFGIEYKQYQQRTKKLLPFLY